MTKIYIIGSGNDVSIILNWLFQNGKILPKDVSSIIDYPESLVSNESNFYEIPVISFNEAKKLLLHNDIIIVASRFLEKITGDLFAYGFFNIYNGNVIIHRENIANRFLQIGASLYVGPTIPMENYGDEDEDYIRYISSSIVAKRIPKHKLFIVNSMPKSGTIWMIAMLEDILGVKAKEQITLSHVGDIKIDWQKKNNHGALVLVRDMRDVVVSWFHHLCRSDIQCGFVSPRYPTIEDFYKNYFIGLIYGSPRYYSGNLDIWLNFVSTKNFPIIKYENLVTDTESAIRKILNFWKVNATDQLISDVAKNYSFDSMEITMEKREGYITDMLKKDHLRRGKISSWRDEMPEHIAKDIDHRFAAYQQRLGYT